MNTIGFPINTKKYEKRRAIIPNDIQNIKNKNSLYFEDNYGKVLGYENKDYIKAGANIVNHNEAIKKDIICDCKIGDADYLGYLKEGQTIFGWVHATENKDISDKLTNQKLTAIAWENMSENSRHVFWRNNELAGESSILHAYSLYGKPPYETKVAILGRGNVARGAYKILLSLGAEITTYNQNTEQLFRKELGNYDVVVNAILWDTNRIDHIIYKKDLKAMKKNAMIIDISCDRNGGIETSIPTTIGNPVYYIDGIMHYVVDNTPTIFYKTASESISSEVCKYLDCLIENNLWKNGILEKALIVKNGTLCTALEEVV